MRILINTINFAPELISTGKYIGEMAAWLSERGHDVRVVTAPPHYPEWKVKDGYSAAAYRREIVGGADTWRCPTWVPARPTGVKRLAYLATFAASSLPVMLSQIRWKPDVVVVIAPPLFSMFSAWLTSRLSGAKTLLRILDFEVDAAMDLGMLPKGKIRDVFYGVESMLMRSATQVATLTEPMRWRIMKKGVPESRVWLSPDWSDIEFVRPMSKDNEVRREFGANEDDVLVMHAGNMGEKQGLELMLDAADLLRDREDVKFVLAGGGAVRDKLQRYAETRRLNNVRFFPVQPLERLPLMLAAADIHLVIQRREAADLVMPSRLTNILAAGRASIATAAPGTALHDILDTHACGVNTPPGDAQTLAAAITALAEDAEERERLGHGAREYAEANLDKHRLLTGLEDRLREMAKAET